MIEDYEAPLAAAHRHALGFIRALPERVVVAPVERTELLDRIDHDLPEDGIAPVEVVEELVRAVDRGLVGSAGPRYFGFVTGGALPGALAADWIASAWDQNPAIWAMSPAAVTVERIVAKWLTELLQLPESAGVGIVTGGQMANWTCLAAARHHVLAQAGWDVEARGLQGAPLVNVVVGEQRHRTIDRALRFLGLGAGAAHQVAADDQGRIVPSDLSRLLSRLDGPLIVCAQAGEVNTGAFDPFHPIIESVHHKGGWVHVDGAFGLWARACAGRFALTAGVDLADSWSVDGHKWLNVPYDTGFAITAHPKSHAAAMTQLAPYAVSDEDARYDPMNWSPEASRRSRAFAVYAAIRTLGRAGIDALVERTCRLAGRFAQGLGSVDGVTILNDVELNQVLVRFEAADDPDEHTMEVIRRVQHDGTCWLGGTYFRGRAAMRISVSNWSTTEDDVDRSIEAILRCADLT